MAKNHLLVEVYQDHTLQWRWRMARSGRIIADSGEGYTRKAKCLQTLKNLTTALGGGKFSLKVIDWPPGIDIKMPRKFVRRMATARINKKYYTTTSVPDAPEKSGS